MIIIYVFQIINCSRLIKIAQLNKRQNPGGIIYKGIPKHEIEN